MGCAFSGPKPPPRNTSTSFRPGLHPARPFPGISSMTSLDFLREACPDAHAHTKDILHSSRGATLEDVKPQRNGFVHTVLDCYNEHHALTIRPDDVWIAIITQFSCFVNGNPEALRSVFVLHDSKKELSMKIHQEQGREDWDFVVLALVQDMNEQIQKNVIDAELMQWMIPAFSTTNLIDQFVCGMVMMATVKEYFTSVPVLHCGIPRVTLEGKKDDWTYILNRLEKLKEFGPQTTAWYRLLHPILSRFVKAFQEPDSPENLEFWGNVAHFKQFEGRPTCLSGWITAFILFDEKGRWMGDGGYNTDDLDQDNKLILDDVTYPLIASIPAGYAQVDITLQMGGTEHSTSLIAGSIGTEIFSSSDKTLSHAGKRDSARPALGWWWVLKDDREAQGSTPSSPPEVHPSDEKIWMSPGVQRTFPWRFVDARAFVRTGAIRLVLVEDISDLDFVSISYVWTDSMKKWRNYISNTDGRTYEERIARGSGNLSTSTAPAIGSDGDAIVDAQHFLTIVAFLVLSRGKKFFWVDIICIDQDKPQEMNLYVPRMGYLYRSASETHAYPFGAEIVSSVYSDKVYFPIWETRAWTVQEQILSQHVLFCYAFQGDVRQELRDIRDSTGGSGPEQVVDLHTPVLDRHRFTDGIYLLEIKGHLITCRMERESWDGNLSLSANLNAMKRGDGSRVSESIVRGTRHKVLWEAKQSRDSNIAETARISMATTAGRMSTRVQDKIYSVLGVLRLMDFPVSYDIPVEEARLRVFEALDPKILAHIIGVDWGSGCSADNKDSALPRVVGSSPVVGIASLKSAIRDCKYTRSVGTQMDCRQEKLRVWAADMHIRRDQGFVQTLFGNRQLLLMQGASIFDMPEAASMPTSAIPRDITKVVIVEMSAFGLTSVDEASEVDKVAEFVEIGMCNTGPIVLPSLPPEVSSRSSLLTLCCEETGSGTLVNRGTALIMDASALSTNYGYTTIE